MLKSAISIIILSTTVLIVNGQFGPVYDRQSQLSQPNQYSNRPSGSQQYFPRPNYPQQPNYDQPNGAQYYQNGQQYYQQDVASRFGDASISSQYNDDFTPRPPPQGRPSKKKPTVAPQPPKYLVNRFDDINKRQLSWDKDLSKEAEQFSLQLLLFVANDEDSNFMISPLSVHNLLVLISEGAAAETYAQINRTLGLISKQRAKDFHQYSNIVLKKNPADVKFEKFAALIGDKNRPVSREYEEVLQHSFDAEYIDVVFPNIDETLFTVNQKVAQKTNGQIQNALSRDDLLKAQLILLAGINFQGNWKNVFNTSFTKREEFKDVNDNQVTGHVNMMFQRGSFPFAAIKDLGCYVVELPYGTKTGNPDDDRFSMIVALPKKGLDMITAISMVHQFGFDKILFELQRAKEEYDDDEVEVHLPRFQMETSVNLVPILKQMGITYLFEQGKANLEGINPNYYVSSVLHKTKIRVDEKGTEAAAVTTSIFANKATPPKFHANRPFFYFIVDKPTKLILFSGVYSNPVLY